MWIGGILFQLDVADRNTLETLPASDPIFANLAVIVILILALVVIIFLARFIFRDLLKLKNQSHAMIPLLVTVPKFRSEEEAKGDASQQKIQELIGVDETIFGAIAGLSAQKGIFAWLLGRNDHYAFEIVAHDKVIKFFAVIPEKHVDFISQQITAQHPDALIEEVEDYNLFTPNSSIVGAYLEFKRPAHFPFRTYEKLESDPLNTIANALSKVPEGEGVAIQYVIRSAPKSWRSQGLKVTKLMNEGYSYDEARKGKKRGQSVGSLLSNKKAEHEPKRQITMTERQKEMVQGIEEKISKGGLGVNIRIIAAGANPVSAKNLLQSTIGAFTQFNIYEYGNAFSASIPSNKQSIIRDYIFRNFKDKRRVVLNSEEMASLWHLPLKTTDIPNIKWMGARTAPAPPETPHEGALKLGYNVYRGKKTDAFLKRQDRQRHMYIIGKSGSGKTNFIQTLALQDIMNGEGVAVLDPHGDMIEWILGNIPKSRVDDVILFDPSDMDRPVGLNMLEVQDESQKDIAVQEMISIFYKLFPPEMIGPMFEHNMRNVMLTLMSDHEEPGTITEIPRMFSDEAYQKQWVAKVKDPVVRSFWENEMAKTSDFHKSEMLGYLISKVGRFVENTMMRNIIGQKKSGFNFRDIMDNKKILLVNLAKGKTGEVNSSLLGMIIVSKLQMAALARADMPEEKREDFYLYIDEFQNFITDSISTILSEARKYRLNLVVGHQYMGQLVKDNKTEIRDAILGNVGSMFVSRIGPEDTQLLEKVYSPTFSAYDLINSDKYTWYAKIIVDNSQINPFTMKTYPSGESDPKLADAIRQLARLKYGKDRGIVEADILERSQVKSTGQPLPVGER